jgi:hypothetical protein
MEAARITKSGNLPKKQQPGFFRCSQPNADESTWYNHRPWPIRLREQRLNMCAWLISFCRVENGDMTR